MKRLIFLFLIIISHTIVAQERGFKLNYSSNTDYSFMPFRAFETSTGYTLSINEWVYDSITGVGRGDKTRIRLTEISKTGVVLNNYFVESPDSSLELFAMLDFGENYFLFATKFLVGDSDVQYPSFLLFSKTAKKIVRDSVHPRYFKGLVQARAIITDDSTISLQSNFADLNNPFFSPDHCMYFKVDKNLKILKQNSFYHGGEMPSDIGYSRDGARLICMASDSLTVRDSNYIQLYKLPNGQEITPTYDAGSSNSSIIIKNDSLLLISDRAIGPNRAITGRDENDFAAYFEVMTKSGRVLKSHILTWNDQIYTQMFICRNKGIDTTRQGDIYLGHTLEFSEYSLGKGFGNAPSYFMLHKLDKNYNITYKKRYGGNDAYYEMSGVLATSDGGCLMYGTRYNFNTIPKTDAYLIKVDGNGTVVSETSIPMVTPRIVVFPNPSSEFLTIDLPSLTGEIDIRIFDAQGKLVLSEKGRSAEKPLNVQELASGNYVLQVWQKGQLLGVAQWVKY
jgi:hypothetical protein